MGAHRGRIESQHHVRQTHIRAHIPADAVEVQAVIIHRGCRRAVIGFIRCREAARKGECGGGDVCSGHVVVGRNIFSPPVGGGKGRPAEGVQVGVISLEGQAIDEHLNALPGFCLCKCRMGIRKA